MTEQGQVPPTVAASFAQPETRLRVNTAGLLAVANNNDNNNRGSVPVAHAIPVYNASAI